MMKPSAGDEAGEVDHCAASAIDGTEAVALAEHDIGLAGAG